MRPIAEKLAELKSQIADAASKIGGNPCLVAVTKIADVEMIRQAYDVGHRDFGENYVQRILPKIDSLPDDIRWHFIGGIQKNKINKMLGRFVLVHTIDSQHIAQAFDVRVEREDYIQDVLLEVNAAGEIEKHGVSPEQCGELAHFIAENCPHLHLTGLMTVAPFTDDTNEIAKCFATARNLKDQLEHDGLKLSHLSMGMTSDWEIALEYGATILRIGTAIFG